MTQAAPPPPPISSCVQALQQALEGSPEARRVGQTNAWERSVRAGKIAGAVVGAGALFAVTGACG